MDGYSKLKNAISHKVYELKSSAANVLWLDCRHSTNIYDVTQVDFDEN